MIDVANFKADPTYTSCDEIVTVGGRVLNSRNAFRARSQLVWAVRCAGKAYVKHHQAPDEVPWQLLQSAYGWCTCNQPRIAGSPGHSPRLWDR